VTNRLSHGTALLPVATSAFIFFTLKENKIMIIVLSLASHIDATHEPRYNPVVKFKLYE
jgi:hypothetical protein